MNHFIKHTFLKQVFSEKKIKKYGCNDTDQIETAAIEGNGA